MYEAYFSADYSEARARFLNAALKAGAQVESYPVSCGLPLDTSIDVAVVGKEQSQTIVVSSGIHGVEGFFGSAVQLALLERFSKDVCKANIRYVLIHALNPYGFASVSRVNEDNIDLNRNFLFGAQNYAGAPTGYADLNAFLNPLTAPSRLEPFALKALWTIYKNGLQTLKESVAAGQYEYPKGLFFGGHKPSQSTCIVQDHRDSWVSASDFILHIDLHTGLGVPGACTLLLAEDSCSKNMPWYRESFGNQNIEVKAQPEGTAYGITGSFVEWMQAHFGSQKYKVITAEFGTHNIIRVLSALRDDNRERFYGSGDGLSTRWVKKEIMECFCPASISWRRRVVESGVGIVDKGVKALGNIR